MTDAIIWISAIILVVLMFWSLVYEQKKRAKMTDEEYQQRATQEPSMLSRGMMELDQIMFRPQAKTAIEYQKDKMRGQTPDQQAQGEKLAEEPNSADNSPQ